MIEKLYYRIWHDYFHLDKPISWIIVSSIKNHLLLWDMVGGTIVCILWFLVMHFIAMK